MIEGRLTGIQYQLTGVGTRLTGVEGRLTLVEDKLTDVDVRLTGVEGRLTGVESGLAELGHQMSVLHEDTIDTIKALAPDSAGNVGSGARARQQRLAADYLI